MFLFNEGTESYTIKIEYFVIQFELIGKLKRRLFQVYPENTVTRKKYGVQVNTKLFHVGLKSLMSRACLPLKLWE